jgi:hypothetical protein
MPLGKETEMGQRENEREMLEEKQPESSSLWRKQWNQVLKDENRIPTKNLESIYRRMMSSPMVLRWE